MKPPIGYLSMWINNERGVMSVEKLVLQVFKERQNCFGHCKRGKCRRKKKMKVMKEIKESERWEVGKGQVMVIYTTSIQACRSIS